MERVAYSAEVVRPGMHIKAPDRSTVPPPVFDPLPPSVDAVGLEPIVSVFVIVAISKESKPNSCLVDFLKVFFVVVSNRILNLMLIHNHFICKHDLQIVDFRVDFVHLKRFRPFFVVETDDL